MAPSFRFFGFSIGTQRVKLACWRRAVHRALSTKRWLLPKFAHSAVEFASGPDTRFIEPSSPRSLKNSLDLSPHLASTSHKAAVFFAILGRMASRTDRFTSKSSPLRRVEHGDKASLDNQSRCWLFQNTLRLSKGPTTLNRCLPKSLFTPPVYFVSDLFPRRPFKLRRLETTLFSVGPTPPFELDFR